MRIKIFTCASMRIIRMNRALGIVLEKKQQMMSGELLNEIDDTSADFVEFILVSRGSGPGPSEYPRVLASRFLK